MTFCNGKKRYKSEKHAKKVKMLREHAVTRLRIYKCPVCFDFHLTSLVKPYERR